VRLDRQLTAEAGPRDAAASGPDGIRLVSLDAQIGRIMHLPRPETEALSTLADGVTLWCTARDRQFVMTTGHGCRDRIVGQRPPDGLTGR
jgi:hypothetical protein